MIKELVVFYRISSASYNKIKLPHATKEYCLGNFIKEFGSSKEKWLERPVSILILPSRANDDLTRLLKKYIDTENYPYIRCFDLDKLILGATSNLEEEIKKSCITPPKMSLGELSNILESYDFGNAKSFQIVYETVCDAYDKNKIPDNTPIYFVEDDYLHLPNSYKVLMEGLERADYCSLYDHNDKYMDPSPNKYITEGGEETKVILTKSTHWKLTNSTTMTFASTAKILREDKDIWMKWTQGSHPMDFDAFIELRNKGRTLITPIPSYSTHTETMWLAPLIDWSKI
jgi:hypothetical protein